MSLAALTEQEVPHPERGNEPRKNLQRLSERVRELAELDAECVPDDHVEAWTRRLTAALVALNGTRSVHAQRRMVREAIMLAASEPLADPEHAVYLKRRARAVARYVRDAAPAVGTDMLTLLETRPSVLVDTLRAFEGTGRRKRGDTRPKRWDALRALYRALGLGGHESQVRRRDPEELA